MCYEENIRAILESNFSQVKDELIDNAVKSILAIKQEFGAELGRSYIKIPDNATNGDMILKVFPDAKGIKSRDSKFITYTLGGFVFTSVDMDWWKAPYGRSE